jgi:hypothetical protein
MQSGSAPRMFLHQARPLLLFQQRKTQQLFQQLARFSISSHPDVRYQDDCISDSEASLLLADIERKMKNKKYLKSHFDAVIQDYKETEMDTPFWSPQSKQVIERLFRLAFSLSGLDAENTSRLAPHVIDLKAKTGVIYPHVDSVKHGGEIVAAVSLLSSRTMRLTFPPENYIVGEKLDLTGKPVEAEYVLKPKSFYVLTKCARYDLAHEILPGDDRRISIVFRDQPKNSPLLNEFRVL